MVDFLMKALPVSILFIAVVFFSGLAFKIATQNVVFKKRSLKFLQNQFFLGLVLVVFTLPLVTVISSSDILVSQFVIRATPVVLGALGALNCWRAFEAVARHYPKQLPEHETGVASTMPSEQV